MSEARGARATIHDLGYRRYLGTRRPQHTRWLVILKNLLVMSWRGWWRAKLWIIGAAMAVVATGAVMYVSRNEIFERFLAGGSQVTWADALLPLSFDWFAKITFTLTLTIASGVVSRDFRAGAFEIYFSRPVRPLDYALGKAGGVLTLTAAVLVGGPLLLALFRLGLSRDLDDLTASLILVPKAVLCGAVAALAYALAPLAFSALSDRPRNTIAAWAAWYLVVGTLFQGIAQGTGQMAIAAVDLHAAAVGLAHAVFEVSFFGGRVAPPLWASALSLAVYTAGAALFLGWRLSRAERAGLGGG